VRAGREVVLFVDDEDFMRDLGQQIFCGCGYRVLLAENGEKALELYRERCQGIDLVVLDLIMPGMGGRHCLQEILKIDPEARVIVSSGYSDHGSVKEALVGRRTGVSRETLRGQGDAPVGPPGPGRTRRKVSRPVEAPCCKTAFVAISAKDERHNRRMRDARRRGLRDPCRARRLGTATGPLGACPGIGFSALL